MNDFSIMFLIGLLIFIIGLLLLIKEIKLFKDSILTSAKVVTYYEYLNLADDSESQITMYTMAVEYHLADGKLIQTREQSGSNGKKYPVGTELKIAYSKEKPELFKVSGDHSKKAALGGMMIFGLVMIAISGYAGLNS